MPHEAELDMLCEVGRKCGGTVISIVVGFVVLFANELVRRFLLVGSI